MKKRGAVSVGFLITMILAVAAFIPLLMFLTEFYGDNSLGVDELCKVSVLTRASAPGSVKNYVGLQCTTKKICFTRDIYGECEQFTGEKDVKRIRLPEWGGDADEKAAKEIERVSAEAKYYCWDAMGQLKLDLVGDFETDLGMSQGEPTCVICSRLALDIDSFSDYCDKNDEEFNMDKCRDELKNVLGKVDINSYMENNNVPGKSLTYAQTFSNNGINNLKEVDVDEEKLEGFIDDFGENIPNLGVIKNIGEIDQNSYERAYVFSQVVQPEADNVLSNLAALGMGIAQGASMTPVIGRAVFHPYVLIPGLVVAGGVAGYGYLNAEAGIEAAASYCGEFQSARKIDDGRSQGCSLVQAVPYDYRYVNGMCASIQGDP